MTRVSSAVDGCRQAERLALMEAAGERLTDEQRDSLAAHRAGCPACRTLTAAADLLRDVDGEGPAAPLDDLAAHRMVNDVLGRLAAEEAAPSPTRATPPARRSRYRLLAVAAVLLLVGAGLGVGIHGLLSRGGSAAIVSPAPRTPVAHVHLSAGQVQLDDAPAEVGLAVRAGQTLRVGGGRATLGLPGHAAVLVEGDTALHVQRLKRHRTTLHLQRGRLLASVRPRPGRPHFTVITAAGRVEVTGTVFSVEHTPQGVAVAVLRGQVRVHENGRPVRLVGRGMRTLMRTANGPAPTTGRSAIRPMDDSARAEAWRRARVLDLIHAEQSAKVTLKTRPAGALVLVDGLMLGQTPLVTRLRAGHHRVVLRKVGHRSVQRPLHVAVGADTTWDVSLASAFLSRGPARAKPPGPAVTRDKPHTGIARRPRVAPPTNPTPPPGPTAVVAPQPPAVPTAKELAQRARTLRNTRKWSAAAAAFKELIRRYPGSGRARTARVSLGLILLDRLGNAKGALAQFSAYLASGRVGALAPEASYGRIRALRRLGRRSAEISALRTFLKLYPRSMHARNARRRLTKLGVKPPPPARQNMGLGSMPGPK